MAQIPHPGRLFLLLPLLQHPELHVLEGAGGSLNEAGHLLQRGGLVGLRLSGNIGLNRSRFLYPLVQSI